MFNMMFLVMFLPSVMEFVPRLGQGANFGGWCKTCFFALQSAPDLLLNLPVWKNIFMKASQFFISTLKEAPAEAAFASHKLMIRAGLIKANASGLYTWMPMGLRVLRKVENVVREEMARAGSVELLMPVVQPAELWQELTAGSFTVKNCCA